MAVPKRPVPLPASPWEEIPPTATPTRAPSRLRRPGGLPVFLSGPVEPWPDDPSETRDLKPPRIMPDPVAPPDTRDTFLPRPLPTDPVAPEPSDPYLPRPLPNPDPIAPPRFDPIELPGYTGDYGAIPGSIQPIPAEARAALLAMLAQTPSPDVMRPHVIRGKQRR